MVRRAARRDAIIVEMRWALLLLTSTASAQDICAPGAKHSGAVIDLDFKQADIQAVLRALTETAHVNLVVGDDVTGTVTLRLKRVAWDAAACSIAVLHHLSMTLDDGILLVTPVAKSPTPHLAGRGTR